MAIIDFNAAECRHCYRCVRSCRVNSIAFRDGHAFVLPNSCILCGECLVHCPQSAKKMASDLEKVKELIRDGRKVVLSLAPSAIGVFGVGNYRRVKTALRKLGFSEIRSTAEGAALDTIEYVRLLREGSMKNIISTACPSVINLIEVHYPDLIPQLAPVKIPSGMHVHMLRDEFGPDAVIAFMGSCLAEKDRSRTTRPDCVLSFEDFRRWMEEEKICLEDCEPDEGSDEYLGANLRYSLSGGLLRAVRAEEEARGITDHYRKLYASSVEDCKEICEAIQSGAVNNCFIEMNTCHGGCINGTEASRRTTGFKLKLELEEALPKYPADRGWLSEKMAKYQAVRGFTDRSVKEKMPTEEQIREILSATGKMHPDQDLNCGACGYSTCRAKAIAVFQGKAELEMCIPYLHKRASSLAHMIMETTPNAILILDENLRILDCSAAVQSFFGLPAEKMYQHVLSEFMATGDVQEVFDSHISVQGKRVMYPERNLITFQNIAYVPESDYVILTIIDVTAEEQQMEKEYQKRKETVDLAHNVIYKQMRVAQQIAGLLGETTAETQTTLTKLCSLFETEHESEVR